MGKTSLVYHVAWMLSKLNHVVLAVDLDPQANLTAAFLDEGGLEKLWRDPPDAATTIYRCVEPLIKVGDIRSPRLQRVSDRLYLLPGDLRLSAFEDLLSTEWPGCLGGAPYRAFRAVTAFWQVIRKGIEKSRADIVLVDAGPSLGAINRSALIATDFVVVPPGADLFSLQGLRNLGPALRRWRRDWTTRREHWKASEFELPVGGMRPVGYLMQQHGVQLSRPVRAYDRWFRRMPAEYAKSVLQEPEGSGDLTPENDPNLVATIKHYRSLIPLAQEARKPIFSLTPADGAMGAHSVAANAAYEGSRHWRWSCCAGWECSRELDQYQRRRSFGVGSKRADENWRAATNRVICITDA